MIAGTDLWTVLGKLPAAHPPPPPPPRDNIRGAVENGFVRSVHVDRRGFCRALWSDVSISLGLKDFLD